MAKRWVVQTVSLSAHGVAFVALLGMPTIRIPRASESEYRQIIEGKEDKIVWYKLQKELPAVRPALAPEKRPPRAETIAKQAIVSSPKDAPKREQMVWTPAPEVTVTPIAESPNMIAVKLPNKQFVAPTPQKQPELTQVDLSDAPVLEAKADMRAPTLTTRLPPKTFTAPARAPGTGVARSATMDSPDNLNVAVVGLNPVDKAVLMPTLPSPGRFSAGPKLNPEGAPGDSSGQGLSVPSLFVAGPRAAATSAAAAAKPNLIAQALIAPTSTDNIRAALRNAQPIVPSAPKVSSAPHHSFDNREVYMMAIQMPNITSSSGSWLMWYSDHSTREPAAGKVSAPVPQRKVDPKYLPSAIADKVEGRVQLLCVIGLDGKVSHIELVRAADERLNASAQEALAKWEFHPATRNGAPIEVDVLVEIPFRLK